MAGRELESQADREGQSAAQTELALGGPAIGALAEAEAVPRRQASLWGDAWRRLVKNRLALIGLIVVVTFVVVAVLAPWIAPYSENEVVDPRLVNHPPTWTWPFG